MQCVQTLDAKITAIYDIMRAKHKQEIIQNDDVVQFPVEYKDKLRNIAVEFQQGMWLDYAFSTTKLGPDT
jgi:hypothetical protein